MSDKPTVYMLCGTAGAGKSWVANQLTHLFHYVSFDGVRKKDHIEAILNAPRDKPILYDPNIKISTFIRRHSEQMNIIPVFIIETEEVIKARIEQRGGKFTEHIPKRMKVMDARNAKYGKFSGTANQVLSYLLEAGQNSILTGFASRLMDGMKECPEEFNAVFADNIDDLLA